MIEKNLTKHGLTCLEYRKPDRTQPIEVGKEKKAKKATTKTKASSGKKGKTIARKKKKK
ncbi:hypothetical protein IH922_10070 [candidate division KSB1 bacterium]|nr:hypothetical protein [candidate division KSB1 bacterium]